ncbi:MAG: response regulator [Candidatus Zhuqueibacterota bacterium]
MDKINVLIVDDNEEIFLLLRRTLETSGYHVTYAQNGFEAITMFGIEKPDIIFLDINMPEMDGIETLRRLTRLEGWGRTVVIILTGYGDITTARQAMQLGAYDYITKPIQLNLIESICREAVEEKVMAHA